MEPSHAADMAIFFALLKAIGVPGVITILISPFLMMSAIVWLLIIKTDRRWQRIDSAHTEERNRDFAHIKELMNSLAGFYQVFNEQAGKMEVIDRSLNGVADSLKQLPDLFRGVHARLDTLFLRKDPHVGSHGSSRPPQSREG